MLLANLAWNLKNQSKMTEARALYEEAWAADPTILQTVLGWARLEEADRNFERAAETARPGRGARAGQSQRPCSRARSCTARRRAYEPALGVLDAIAAQRQDVGLGPNEMLEKGRLLDQMGRYEDAFVAFVDGKRLVREVSGTRYLADHAAQTAGRLKSFFTANRMKITPRATVRADVPQPLFIIGFPRSGTTLTEQTLGAHSQISAGDELPYIVDITGLMQRMLGSPLTYPDAMSRAVDGRSARGAGQSARLLSAARRGSRASSIHHGAGSPTRCR